MGSMSSATKLVIVLVCLIVLAFGAGLAKLYINKKGLKKNIESGSRNATRNSADKEKFTLKKLEEGEYFDAGGVGQSRPDSLSSSRALVQNQPLVDWDKVGTSSASASILDFGGSYNGSVRSLPMSMNPIYKPSPLLLGRSELEKSSSGKGTFGGSHLTPSRSPLSQKSGSPLSSDREERWVSPLDVHFDRPVSPLSFSPTSYLSKLQFPWEVETPGPLSSTPGSDKKSKPDSASITSVESSSPSQILKDDPQTEACQIEASPVQPPTPSREARQSGRFEKGSMKSKPSFLLAELPPHIATIDPNRFPRDIRQWNPPSPVIRDSIATKKRVSVYRPPEQRALSHGKPLDKLTSHIRPHSIAASSIYSTTSTMDPGFDSPTTPPRIHTHFASTGLQTPPPSRKRSNTAESLSIRRDSTSSHSRKFSLASSKDVNPKTKGHSRDRDQIHYDTAPTRRDRSDSIQGRIFDFEHPREPPYPNANTTSNRFNHSRNSSISSAGHDLGRRVQKSATPRQQTLASDRPNKDIMLEVPNVEIERGRDRLSVNTMGSSMFRSASETSQGSISEFYDAYYRQSTMNQTDSMASLATAQATAMTLKTPASLMPGEDGTFCTEMSDGNDTVIGEHEGNERGVFTGRKPQPLRLGPSSVGGSGLAGETIMELPSPVPSPLPAGKVRLPPMI